MTLIPILLLLGGDCWSEYDACRRENWDDVAMFTYRAMCDIFTGCQAGLGERLRDDLFAAEAVDCEITRQSCDAWARHDEFMACFAGPVGTGVWCHDTWGGRVCTSTFPLRCGGFDFWQPGGWVDLPIEKRERAIDMRDFAELQSRF